MRLTSSRRTVDLVGQLRRATSVVGVGAGAVQPANDRVQRHRDTGQGRPDAVVQVAAQPATFLLPGGDHVQAGIAAVRR